MVKSKGYNPCIPTFFEIILILLSYFLLTDIIIPKSMKHFIEFQDSLQSLFYIHAVSKVLSIVILLIIINKHLSKLIKEFKSPQVYKYGLIGFFQNLFLRYTLGIIIIFIVGPSNFQSSMNQKLLIMVISQYPFFMFLSTVIIAPIVEEIIFRFAIFKPLSLKNKPIAYIFSSFLFGFLHISTSLIFMRNFNELYTLPLYISSGLVLAYVYDKTDKLAAPILVHMLNNYMGFALIVLKSYS